jgi:hypothetical protein
MDRELILNKLIHKNGYKSYLEIGVQSGWLFSRIVCDNKVGVDPVKIFDSLTYNMTSDDFFAQNSEKFDIVFIDGLHHHEQVIKDFENSLACLNIDGLILFHDCNPTIEEWQAREPVVSEWTGDCWKAIVQIRQNYDFHILTVNCDYGVGICNPFRYDYRLAPVNCDLTYVNLDINRNQWLNLKSELEFKSEYEL